MEVPMKVHIRYDDGAFDTYPPIEHQSKFGVVMVEPLTDEGRLVMHFKNFVLSRCDVYSFAVELDRCKHCDEVMGSSEECTPWSESGHMGR
jgi:hypothetical protein